MVSVDRVPIEDYLTNPTTINVMGTETYDPGDGTERERSIIADVIDQCEIQPAGGQTLWMAGKLVTTSDAILFVPIGADIQKDHVIQDTATGLWWLVGAVSDYSGFPIEYKTAPLNNTQAPTEVEP